MRFRDKVQVKTPRQISYMREAGLVVAHTHAALRAACKSGVTTAELDDVSREAIRSRGARSNFLNYHGFPATTCISVNDEIVHGIPGKRILRDGDLVTFDCGAYVVRDGKQWHGDAAFTMVVGDSASDPRGDQLNALTHRALTDAIAALASGAQRLNAVGDSVEATVALAAQENGWEAGIVEEYVGHGIGNAMHESPDVYNYSVKGRLTRLQPGMVFALEPMLTAGSPDNHVASDEWTVLTDDGSWAAQWEHTVAIMPGGVWVLTAADGGVEILAPYGLSPVPVER